MKLRVMLQLNPGPRKHAFLMEGNRNLKRCHDIRPTVTKFNALNRDVCYKIAEELLFALI